MRCRNAATCDRSQVGSADLGSLAEMWYNRLDEHPVHASLASARAVLEQPSEVWSNEELIGRRERLKFVLITAEDRLRSADRFLVRSAMLEGIRNAADSLYSVVTTYCDQDDAAFLDQADNAADDLLQFLATLLTPGTEADRSSVESVRTVASETIARLGELVQEAEQRATTAESKLAQFVNETKQRYEEYGAEATSKIDSLQAQIDTMRSEADTARSDFSQWTAEARSQFDTAQHDRSNQFGGLLEQQRTAGSQCIDEFAEQGATERESERDAATEFLARLEQLWGEAAELVGVIGNTGLSGGYRKWADEQKTQADGWRIVAIVAGGLGLLWVIFWSVLHVSKSPTAADVLARLPPALISAGLATYAGRESGRHRKLERHGRLLELQLASLGPFLAEFHGEDRNKIKAELVQPLFTPAPLEHDTGENETVGTMKAFEVVKLLAEKLPGA